MAINTWAILNTVNGDRMTAAAVCIVSDAPTIVSTSLIADEDTALKGDLLATDADGDALTFTVLADVSTTAGGFITVNADGSFVYEPATDFSGTDSFAVTVTDGTTPVTQTITVTVEPAEPANDAPVITSAPTISVAENSTAVLTVTATDTENDPRTFSIEGGVDQALFQIDPSTGVLSFIAAPDFEAPGDIGVDNVYDVIVGATDAAGSGQTTTQAITVTVTDVAETNTAPTATNLSAVESTGEAAVAFDLTDIVVADSDGDPLTVTLTIGDPTAGSLSVGTSNARS